MKYSLRSKNSEEFKDLEYSLFADFETDGLGGEFIIGACVSTEDDEVEYFYSIREFIDKYLIEENAGLKIYFHNLEYDGRYIIDELLRTNLKFNIINRVARVLSINLLFGEKKQVSIIDTFALLSDSLKRLTKVFAPDYEKKVMDFDNEVFDPTNPVHMEYLKYDVLGLKYVYIRARRAIHDTFKVNARLTAASTALEAWKVALPKGTSIWRLSKDKEDFVRMAYSGGLLYVKRPDFYQDVYVYDFNSMYPSVMRDYGVPDGNSFWTDRVEGPGFYHVIVHAENAVFPFLFSWSDGVKYSPQKSDVTFESYITDREYYLARRLGYKISVIKGIAFKRISYHFKEFVDECEQLRLAHGKDAIGSITKLIQNSLYGKFGSKTEVESIEYDPNILEGVPFLQDINDPELPTHLYIKKKAIDRTYMLPHFAAYITANARCRLVEAAVECGVENVVYCDTDSLFITAPANLIMDKKLGDKYGLVKLEAHMGEILIISPKMYFGTKSSSKGFPKKQIERLYNQLISGKPGVITFTSLNSCRTILSKQTGYTRSMTRTIPPLHQGIIDRYNVAHSGSTG
jgi:hypothetical protein